MRRAPSAGLWRLSSLVVLGLAGLALYGFLFHALADLHSATPTRVEVLLPAVDWLKGPLRLFDVPLGATAEDRHAAAAPLYLLIVTTSFAVYVGAAALLNCRGSPAAVVVVLVFSALFQGLALISPTMLSTDVYSYIIYGRMFGVYGGNPYVEVPIQYPGDPFLGLVFWKFAPSFYGPVWTLLSGLLARLAGENVGLAVLLFRSVGALSALVATVLVALVLARRRPATTATGALILGWNPLIVVEGGLSGHNDVLMSLFVLAAFALVAARRPATAVGALVLGGLVKYVALALGPLLVLYVLRMLPSWRARLLFIPRAGLVGAAVMVAAVAPVWAGPETFAVGALGTGGDRYTNALGELALGELRVWLGESREDTEVPLQFRGWWVATHTTAALHPDRSEASPIMRQLDPWSELLVVGSEKLGWIRVYDPVSQAIGFVRSAAVGPIDRPAEYDADAAILARERGPDGSPALQEANRLIRFAGWGLFAAVWLAALVLGTRSLAGLAQGWALAMLSLYYLATSWFWPWYVLWALAAVALVPSASLTRWVVWLSWGALVLYAALGFGETDLWYLQTYRSLAVFGVPALLFASESGLRLAGRLTTALRSPDRPRRVQAEARQQVARVE